MDTKTLWFDHAVAQLQDPQNRKVWSVIVSLFGDLAQGPDDQISGTALTAILQPMGLRPEAIRVALHRLRKDGWIASDRVGRTSVHFLTEFGRGQSAGVTPRIYDRAPRPAETWHLLIASDGRPAQVLADLLLSRDYVSLGRHAALGPGPLPHDCDDLIGFDATARTIPDWLRTQLFPQDLVRASKALCETARDLRETCPAPGALSALQIACLRTLLIHRWRRVVLRQRILPAIFCPKGWPGESCRFEVFAFLDQLPKPDIAQINGG